MSIVRCARCNGQVDLDFDDMALINDEMVHFECLSDEEFDKYHDEEN